MHAIYTKSAYKKYLKNSVTGTLVNYNKVYEDVEMEYANYPNIQAAICTKSSYKKLLNETNEVANFLDNFIEATKPVQAPKFSDNISVDPANVNDFDNINEVESLDNDFDNINEVEDDIIPIGAIVDSKDVMEVENPVEEFDFDSLPRSEIEKIKSEIGSLEVDIENEKAMDFDSLPRSEIEKIKREIRSLLFVKRFHRRSKRFAKYREFLAVLESSF